MYNASINGETLGLRSGVIYLIIDALYVNKLRKCIIQINGEVDLTEIKKQAFPFTDLPFVKFTCTNEVFHVQQFRKIDRADFDTASLNQLVSDTGVFVFISLSVLQNFIQIFDYALLVDSDISLIDMEYWKEIYQTFQENQVGLIIPDYHDESGNSGGGGKFQIDQI
jgi:hypothetical protein